MRQALLPVTFWLLGSFAVAAWADTPAEKRSEIVRTRAETLERLYKVHPAAKAKVQSAYGYAVFSNANINLFHISLCFFHCPFIKAFDNYFFRSATTIRNNRFSKGLRLNHC